MVPGGLLLLVARLGLRLESTFVGVMGRITYCHRFACLECMIVVPGAIFWINPPTVMKSPKLMEFISLNHKPLLVITFMPIYMFN